MRHSLFVMVWLLGLSHSVSAQAIYGNSRFFRLSQQLEQLRQDLNIPGMSAAVTDGNSVVWSSGFGFADLERNLQAVNETSYRISTLGEPVLAFLMLSLAEEGNLSLDDLAENYDVKLKNSKVRLRHLLSHTSSGTPGEKFSPDPGRLDRLANLFEVVLKQSYSEVLNYRVLKPFGMTRSAPYRIDPVHEMAFADTALQEAVKMLATCYGYEPGLGVVPAADASASGLWGGWISTAEDYARFLQAQDTLLSAASLKLLYSPGENPKGIAMPYAMGWFIQEVYGHTFAWNAGYSSPGHSSLVVRDLVTGLSFILMANSDRLSRPFWLQGGDLLRSPAALIFLRTIVFPSEQRVLLSDAEQEAADRISYATLELEPVGGLEKILLWFVFVIQLSALLLWPVGWLSRLRSRIFHGFWFTVSRYFALTTALLSLISNALFSKWPELHYWGITPEWQPAQPFIENLLLMLPTIIFYLLIPQVLVTLMVWIRRSGSPTFRTHLLLVTIVTALYALLLHEWNLIDFAFWV